MKNLLILFLAAVLALTPIACSSSELENVGVNTVTQVESLVSGSGAAQPVAGSLSDLSLFVAYDSEDLNPDDSDPTATNILLEGDLVLISGDGAVVQDHLLTITAPGRFRISGVWDDGQVVVNTQEKGTVTLILDGVNITYSTSAPLYVRNADKVIITLAQGADNEISDGSAYIFEGNDTDEPDAAIFSKDDLTINGSGSLTVSANYKNGIASKDGLKIVGSAITVNAVNDGIRGRDFIAVRGASLTINTGGDGLQSNHDEDSEKGFILLEGGTLDITADLDGIQAQTRLAVNGSNLTLSTGGGCANNSLEGGGMWGDRGMQGNPDKPVVSAKGLKAGNDITIASGLIAISSADDAIHSNNSVTIDGGQVSISSGDDGIHSYSLLTINNGKIEITKSYEGIESTTIALNGGQIYILASDDGVNVAGGNDGSSLGGRAGENAFEYSGNNHLYINDGYFFVDSMGDGIDVNGGIDMAGGIVVVNGPVNNGNGPLDYLGAFNITGGYLLAVGSSGMAQVPGASSSQYSLLYNFDSMQAAGELVHIETIDGQDLLTFAPTKSYQSVVFSSPDLAAGLTYLVYSGGSAGGVAFDGRYASDSYAAGIEVARFTISNVVTSAGASAGFGSGGFIPGGGPGNGAPRP